MGKIVNSNKFKHDLSGQIFGLLYVNGYAFSLNKRRYWECACACGKLCHVQGTLLTKGATSSCGCLRGESHGDTDSKEHNAWLAMRKRCSTRKTNRDYDQYAGRGITICDRWESSYTNFLNDMGRAPSLNHSLDRKDNDKGYYKNNCRWALPTQQANNRSNNRLLTISGHTKTITEWCDTLNIVKASVAFNRIITLGWDPEKAVKTPARKKMPNNYCIAQ